MTSRHFLVVGVTLISIGFAMIFLSVFPSALVKEKIEEGNFEFYYPSDWNKTISQLNLPEDQFGNPLNGINIDLIDRKSTIHIRIVFIDEVTPIDILKFSEIIAGINSNQENYQLIELKQIVVNGQTAVRRIETYRTGSAQEPQLWTLVATYFSSDRGFYSVLLMDSPWTEMESQLEVYEQIVDGFRILQ